MNSVMEVHLHKVRLFGFHGLHKGEDLLGGDFEVNLTTTYIPASLSNFTLDDTIDYTKLLSIVRNRMGKPASLLETLAAEISSEIFAKFPTVNQVAISISKLHPPIENFDGSVAVTLTTKRDQ